MFGKDKGKRFLGVLIHKETCVFTTSYCFLHNTSMLASNKKKREDNSEGRFAV